MGHVIDNNYREMLKIKKELERLMKFINSDDIQNILDKYFKDYNDDGEE